MKFNRKVYRVEMDRMLKHPKAINVFIVIIVISAIAMMATAYQHDTFFSVFDPKELAKMDTWFLVFALILIATTALFALWPIMSIVIAACCATIPLLSKKTDKRINKDGERLVQIKIDEDKLRAMFSKSFPKEKFDAFVIALKESELKKRDIGKLAEMIMFSSPYCSDNPKYRKKLRYQDEMCFTPYCEDFFSSLGVSSSSPYLSYYSEAHTDRIKRFEEIIDYDSKKK